MDISLWVNSWIQTDLLKTWRNLQVSSSYHRHTDTNLLGGSKYLLLYLLLKSCRSHSEYFCIPGELVLILIFHLCTEIRPAGLEGPNRKRSTQTAHLTIEIKTKKKKKKWLSIIVIIWIVHYPMCLNWRLLIKLQGAAYVVQKPSKEKKETRRESN